MDNNSNHKRISGLSVLHSSPKYKLYKFQKELEVHARLNYGDLALMFVDDEYFIPPAIEVGEVDDADDVDLTLYNEEKKLRIKDIHEMKKNCPNCIKLSKSREVIMKRPN